MAGTLVGSRRKRVQKRELSRRPPPRDPTGFACATNSPFGKSQPRRPVVVMSHFLYLTRTSAGVKARRPCHPGFENHDSGLSDTNMRGTVNFCAAIRCDAWFGAH